VSRRGLGQASRNGKVLEGVGRIGWDTTTCVLFVGSTIAAMRYLGEKVTNEYVMGISGGAFKMFWEIPWGPANCDLLIIGEEPVRRTFDALGHDFTLIRKWRQGDPVHTEREFRELIVESIGREIPVIGIGIVGPPECCIITGYGKGGDVLHGWSYFQEDRSQYFSKEDWYKDCYGLILIGEEKPKPSHRKVILGSLIWAIKLAKEPEFIWGFPRIRRCRSGLAAFDAMADQLLWDPVHDYEFPANNLDALSARVVPITNDGILIMECKRAHAARFVRTMATQGLPGADELLEAAAAYEQEVQVWHDAAKMAPGWGEVAKEKLADRKHRRRLSRLIREAKVHEERAVEHLENALEELAER